jgi:predicted GNAT family N-acyltransferase
MRIEIVPYHSVPYQHSLMIRDHVLRKPLGLDIANDDIYDEDQHIHIVAIDEERVVGVVVLIPHYEPGVGKLRQMATLEQVRGKGFGVLLVQQLEKAAKRSGMHKICLHARHHAVGFYEKVGYRKVGELFQEVGMDHYRMEKELE